MGMPESHLSVEVRTTCDMCGWQLMEVFDKIRKREEEKKVFGPLY